MKKEGSIWVKRVIYDRDDKPSENLLCARYTNDGWNTIIEYYIRISSTIKGVCVTVEKEDKLTGLKTFIFTKEIFPVKNDNSNLSLEVRPNWYSGFTHDFKENEYINKRLNFLFKESVINVLLDMLALDPPEGHIGQYSNKFNNPEEALLAVLSSNPLKKKRIIHTKCVSEILDSVELYRIDGMELDGRLISAIQKYANKEFEIVDDIRELEDDFISRNIETSVKKERAEFYKVKDLSNPDSGVKEVSAFMVSTIREVED